ncbi:MAG TPA: sigma-54 dependent transcriptional regulator [Blastocatellia bacterium]|nr:sigma-54 dependent transcriptional regulator [Blastocatellia bacterium]HMZ22735.1 sigma-54 dependent transcriptional regulator [Blastocatellia bacterium]HNG31011.1 sigma-54 dependent transcriptional regulator [Blastocatellia bacterium]
MFQTTQHILIADDERSIRVMLEAGLRLNGFRVTSVPGGREALSAAQREHFDGVLCDIFMPNGNGLEVVRGLRTHAPETPIILMTAQGSVDLAVQAMSEGASDFIAKPFEIAALIKLLRQHIAARQELVSNQSVVPPSLEDLSRTGLAGRSPAMVRVYKLIAQAARTEATVLITGETGTGKELVARAVHSFSARAARPFLAVNCAGLTDTLLESELFGHVKGSFTGAQSDRAGLFESADGGTIFLDELATTSSAFQASLLRVLQSGEVRRVGATTARRVNVRVIGASNACLQSLADAGQFRPDLFYRLSVIGIELPTLRERGEDIDLLTAHFLRKLSAGQEPELRLTQDAAAALRAYAFPGNVRELENALTHAAALATNRLITLDCLPSRIGRFAATPNKTDAPSMLPNLITDWPRMEELQRRYLELTLARFDGNRSHAAEALGLDRRTVQRLLSRQLETGEDPADENTLSPS